MTKEEKEHKRELQELRTKINKLQKCINRIEYITEHINVKPYDYGEAHENAIQSIRETIRNNKMS